MAQMTQRVHAERLPTARATLQMGGKPPTVRPCRCHVLAKRRRLLYTRACVSCEGQPVSRVARLVPSQSHRTREVKEGGLHRLEACIARVVVRGVTECLPKSAKTRFDARQIDWNIRLVPCTAGPHTSLLRKESPVSRAFGGASHCHPGTAARKARSTGSRRPMTVRAQHTYGRAFPVLSADSLSLASPLSKARSNQAAPP